MLKFSPANAKTSSLYKMASIRQFLFDKRKVYSLDLPSGHSCPGAKHCKSMAVENPNNPRKATIKDGKDCRFRCFSASQEAQYPALRDLRRHNFDTIKKLRSAQSICRTILADLPPDAGVIRYHVAGDFTKLSYLQGAILVAKARPDVLFYTYTKSLNFLFQELCKDNKNHNTLQLPPNFRVTVSRGGRYDYLIEKLGIRSATVVYSEEEANKLGLPIDHNDSFAASDGNVSFSILIHGTQPPKSKAVVALAKLRGKGSYTRKKKRK